MQIKPPALALHIQKKIAPVYVLIGQDTYQIEEAFHTIKSAIKSVHDCDIQMINVSTTDEWCTVFEEANSYSLFSDAHLIVATFEKKTIDTAAKGLLIKYLSSTNDRSFIVLRAPNIAVKQIAWLTSHEKAVVVVAYPLTQEAMKRWIAMQLKQRNIECNSNIPDLIHQYTQGNMLACAQVIEKISLAYITDQSLTEKQVMEQLFDQCHHSLYELVDACLLGQGNTCIQILRQAAQNKTEAVLVLWMLTQEVRLLSQLIYLLSQKSELKIAAQQLKIWPQRLTLYQTCVKRLNHSMCQSLLNYCQEIDNGIKTGRSSHQIWNALEKLSLNLCLGV